MQEAEESENELFLKALGQTYSEDKTAPGIVSAYLRTQGQFYVAIKRYTEKFGEGGYVVLARKANTYKQAFEDVKNAWLDWVSPKESALEKLLKNKFN